MDEIPCKKCSIITRVVLGVVIFCCAIGTIVHSAGGNDLDETHGEWLDIPIGERGTYVCTMPKPSTGCGTKFKEFSGKCFVAAEKAVESRDIAQQKCKAYHASASLAIIENDAENKFAVDLCEGTYITDNGHCYHGLIGTGDTSQKSNWKWIDGSTSTYRNWWEPGPWEEPTGDGENACSFVTKKVIDNTKGFLLFGFIIAVIWLGLVISCGCMNSVFVIMGLKQRNKCCIITGASLDGTMTAVLFLFAMGSLRGLDIYGLLTNLILGAMFLTGSILGCCQCNRVDKMPPPGQAQMGMVGQPIGYAQPVAAQPVVGTVLK